MTITLPRLRFLAPLFAASVFCASALGGYFSSGSAGVLTACFLLFLLTAAVRPTRREWGVGAIPAALFAFFRTVGYSSAASPRTSRHSSRGRPAQSS